MLNDKSQGDNKIESFSKKIKSQEDNKIKKFVIVLTVLFSVFVLLVIFPVGIRRTRGNVVANIKDIPVYDGSPYVVLNGGNPLFDTDKKYDVFEKYSELDEYGRCGVAFANVCKEIMPTEERGELEGIWPSGWNQGKYPGVVESNPPYLYNRCHLIGFQLTGENANEQNLITGTRYFNVEGMLPFENQVREYVDRTDNHVLYRVTPVFIERELVARGVIMEAWSVEDNGKGVSFNVFVYNVQPGVTINYIDGSNELTVIK